MTKPKDDQRCQRCFARNKIPGPGSRYCAECRGRCEECGAPSRYNERGKFFSRYCRACERVKYRPERCTKCGGPMNGSHTSYCRTCFNAYYRELRASDPEEYRRREWRKEIRKYGITEDDWQAMHDRQDGRCAACGGEEAHPGRSRLCVDHDHTTGAVRELLCTSCNLAIGYVGEDPERLRRLAVYLERHQNQI